MPENTDSDDENFARALLNQSCIRPIETVTGQFVRCGSRLKHRCPSCAELYRSDWAAIARSGVFEGPADRHRFYLLTLTAPSFGSVHRVPRSESAKGVPCRCGSRHDVGQVSLAGTPISVDNYDYAGQVEWNRDSGTLWDRTRRRLRDRWDSVEYFVVREWQARGVIHVHALIRIARIEAPDSETLRKAASLATAASVIDGQIVRWGSESACDDFRVGDSGAKAIWYLSKALNYVLKDFSRSRSGVHADAWAHISRLHAAARLVRCAPECVPSDCGSQVHRRFGARSQVASASRRTSHRTGWSFAGLTRRAQKEARIHWARSHADANSSSSAQYRRRVLWALEYLARTVSSRLEIDQASGP
ncbi:replication initiator [Subtercola sp. RTI3]|uniref:replication initiator n=1 Tax=Subtercola sp. RTI3 TaxID=3048639 RepID=UPI003A598D48